MNWGEGVALGSLPLFKRKHSAKEEADCGAQGHIGHGNGTAGKRHISGSSSFSAASNKVRFVPIPDIQQRM
jgi:hypothetical protein